MSEEQMKEQALPSDARWFQSFAPGGVLGVMIEDVILENGSALRLQKGQIFNESDFDSLQVAKSLKSGCLSRLLRANLLKQVPKPTKQVGTPTSVVTSTSVAPKVDPNQKFATESVQIAPGSYVSVSKPLPPETEIVPKPVDLDDEPPQPEVIVTSHLVAPGAVAVETKVVEPPASIPAPVVPPAPTQQVVAKEVLPGAVVGVVQSVPVAPPESVPVPVIPVAPTSPAPVVPPTSTPAPQTFF